MFTSSWRAKKIAKKPWCYLSIEDLERPEVKEGIKKSTTQVTTQTDTVTTQRTNNLNSRIIQRIEPDLGLSWWVRGLARIKTLDFIGLSNSLSFVDEFKAVFSPLKSKWVCPVHILGILRCLIVGRLRHIRSILGDSCFLFVVCILPHNYIRFWFAFLLYL